MSVGRIRRDYRDFLAEHGRWAYGRASAFDQVHLGYLTRRKLEVFLLLGTGASNSDLMDLLYVSEPTIKGHVSHIMAKLHLTRAEVVACSARLLIGAGPAGPAREKRTAPAGPVIRRYPSGLD